MGAKKKSVPAKKIQHPFFKGLSSDNKKTLMQLGKPVSKSKGEAVFRDSGKAETFYLLLRGSVNLLGIEQDVRFETESEKRIFQTLKAGDVVGWSWLITPYRWKFDAVVEQDAELFAIDGVKLRKAMEKNHSLGYEVYKLLLAIVNQRLIASRLKLQMFGAAPFLSSEGA